MHIASSTIQQNFVLAPAMREISESTLPNVLLLVTYVNIDIINLKNNKTEKNTFLPTETLILSHPHTYSQVN
jgi:hypothetical protein